MTSHAKLQEWHDMLQTGNSRVCGFSHHPLDPELPDRPLCPPRLQNTMHGCIHAAHYFLRELIGEMRREQFLDPREADRYYQAVNHNADLFRLDQRVALDIVTDAEYAGIKREQERIIGLRAAVAQELQEKVRSALDATREQTDRVSLPLLHH